MVAATQLPQPVANELLQQYADVLRVGRLRVNGSVVTWGTGASKELQLRAFCSAFFEALRRLPEASGLRDTVLRWAAYWLCKALSINYVLAEVLELVTQKVGSMCCIETCEAGGAGLVDYDVEVVPGPMLRVGIGWRSPDNIVYRDPGTAEKEVKGTLSRLETEFPLPPARGYVPVYSLQLEFKKSLARQFMSSVSCTDSSFGETTVLLQPEAPLSRNPVELEPPLCLLFYGCTQQPPAPKAAKKPVKELAEIASAEHGSTTTSSSEVCLGHCCFHSALRKPSKKKNIVRI